MTLLSTLYCPLHSLAHYTISRTLSQLSRGSYGWSLFAKTYSFNPIERSFQNNLKSKKYIFSNFFLQPLISIPLIFVKADDIWNIVLTYGRSSLLNHKPRSCSEKVIWLSINLCLFYRYFRCFCRANYLPFTISLKQKTQTNHNFSF